MIVYTHDQVLKKIEDFCNQYKFYSDAAAAIPCSVSQLSAARAGKITPAATILKAIGIERVTVFAKIDP